MNTTQVSDYIKKTVKEFATSLMMISSFFGHGHNKNEHLFTNEYYLFYYEAQQLEKFNTFMDCMCVKQVCKNRM